MQYCRRLFKNGGVAILAHNNLSFEEIELKNYCREKDLEICAIEVKLSTILLILCVYRSPTGSSSYFLTQMEKLLSKLYKPSQNINICGDFNINFLDTHSKASELELLLQSFCLKGIVDFVTRITNNSQTLIDNIFLDNKNFQVQVTPVINGMSDHDGQLAILTEVICPYVRLPPISKRVIDGLSLKRFLNLYSYENWEPVFSGQNINTMFNVFLDTFIKIFHTCFPEILRTNSKIYKQWLTQGIRKSCLNKKNLYQNLKYNKDSSFKLYFSTYCKMLKSTTEISKKKYFDSLIHKSNNKTKMVWHLVKTTTNNKNSNNKITSMSINGNLIDDPVTIANSFNLFFSTVTQSATFAPIDKDFLNNSLPNQIQDTLVHF